MSRDSALNRSPRFSVSVQTRSWTSFKTYGSIAASTGAFMASSRVSILSFDRRRRARALAQDELLDLSCRRLGQLAEHHRPGRLEAREMRPAVLDQLGLGHARAGL